MPIASGTKLGPYEILSALGAGGMGEVYRAKDTRLDRIVAIKTLSSSFSSNPDFRQRFEREARAVSSLNHPHICTLYDVGRQDDTEYLVMELIEGETLASRLQKGPLPVVDVLRYSIQVASALDKAHRHGIVHRDLKPGNIMLTKAGVKLLDFGLAKVQAAAPQPSELSSLPTEQRHLTGEGTILGTIQYMAPEQLEGKPADARTDIFAFGSVVYEMATGRRAFEGNSQASVIAAILKEEAKPISSTQPLTPPALDRVVQTCLAKDPDDRWQSMHDVKAELEWISTGASQAASPVPRPASQSRRSTMVYLLLGLLAGAVLAAVFLPRPHRDSAGLPLRKLLLPLENLKASFRSVPNFSPDGRMIVYLSSDGLRIRKLDQFETIKIPETSDASSPFWSPDGGTVVFAKDKRLWKFPLSGGQPVEICQLPETGQMIGGAWKKDGTIVFAAWRGSLYGVSSQGGDPTVLVKVDPASQVDFHAPQVLPDGETVLLVIHNKNEMGTAAALTGNPPRLKTLLEQPTQTMAAYSSTGHLLYARTAEDGSSAIWGVAFDASRLEVTGKPFLAAPEGDLPNVSPDGTLIFYRGEDSVPNELVWVSHDGKIEGSAGVPMKMLGSPTLSPDGRKLAFSAQENGNVDVWVQDLQRGVRTRVTFDPGLEGLPGWMPSGDQLCYVKLQRVPLMDIEVTSSNGSGTPRRLASGIYPRVSPDGKFLVYATTEKADTDLWYLPLAGDGKPHPFLATPFSEKVASFSPDGRWLLYQSNESGRTEIFLSRFPSGDGKVQASANGGGLPFWSRNGDRIYYLEGDYLMELPVKDGDVLQLGTPQKLFSLAAAGIVPTIVGLGYPNMDATPDGRFIAVRKTAGSPSGVVMIENWFSEFRPRIQ